MSYNNYGQWITSGHIVIDPDKITGISGTSAAPVITITGSGNAPTINQSSVNPSSPVGISSTSAGTGSTFYQNGVGITPNGGAGTGSNIYDTARDTANKNHQLGIDYAEGVKNSAYQSAEAATAEANRRAQNQYQRTVVDSQSAYQRAIGAYGSNAEALASRGLSGSGYGEWLQGNAYATHRGEVQSAAAQRLATQNEAAYKEAQAKAAADATYGQFLYQNDVDKNNALQGIDEQEASDAEAKVNASFTTALDLLNKGWTIDEVQNYIGADAWAALGDKVGQLTTASEVANRIKAETEGKDAQGQLLSYLDLAASGQYTLDALEAIAKSLGQYDALSAKGEGGTSLWDQVAKQVQSNTNNQTVQDMIDNGTTAEDIKNSDAYAGLTPEDQGKVDNIITERDEAAKTEQEERQATIDSLVENFVTAKDDEGKPLYTTLAQVESELTSFEYTATEKKEIISAWQKRNADDFTKELKEVTFDKTYNTSGDNPELQIVGDPVDADDIIYGIEQGNYGDHAEAVIKSFVDAYLKASAAISTNDDTRLSKLSYVRGQFTKLKKALGGKGVDISTVDSAIESITKLINPPKNGTSSGTLR